MMMYLCTNKEKYVVFSSQCSVKDYFCTAYGSQLSKIPLNIILIMVVRDRSYCVNVKKDAQQSDDNYICHIYCPTFADELFLYFTMFYSYILWMFLYFNRSREKVLSHILVYIINKYSTGPYYIDKICGCVAFALRFL